MYRTGDKVFLIKDVGFPHKKYFGISAYASSSVGTILAIDTGDSQGNTYFIHFEFDNVTYAVADGDFETIQDIRNRRIENILENEK